jgi:hypothetical protein
MKILASLKELEPEQFYVVSELTLVASVVPIAVSLLRGIGYGAINTITVFYTIIAIVFIIGLYYIIDAVKVNYPMVAWLIALIPIFKVLYAGIKAGNLAAKYITKNAYAYN